MNWSPLSWHFEIELLREHLLNVMSNMSLIFKSALARTSALLRDSPAAAVHRCRWKVYGFSLRLFRKKSLIRLKIAR